MTNLRCLLFFAALCLGSCGSTPPSRFYLLTPVEEAPASEPLELAVRLRPLDVAGYLANPEIVTRQGNEMQAAEFDRWGEPLRESVSRTLGQNLARLVPTQDVAAEVWSNETDGAVLVGVALERFEVEGATAVLQATWGVSTDEDSIVRMRRTRVEEPVGDEGYAAVARALSQALGELSREIAEAVRQAGE